MQQFFFKLEHRQAIEALTKHYQKDRLRRPVFIRLFLLWAFCMSLLLGLLIAFDGANWLNYWGNALIKVAMLYALIIAAIWALHFFVLLPYFSRRYVKRHQAILQPQKWAWNHQQISIHNAFMRASFLFSSFYAYYEYENYIALYMTAEKFNIIPKSALNSEQLQELRNLLSHQIQNPQLNKKRQTSAKPIGKKQK